MSNNYWDDEDDDQDTQEQLVGDDLVKKLRKAKRADEKRIKELTDQLEIYTKKQREETVKTFLAKKGVNEKASRLILKDLEEVTEDSVSNWLNDNGDLIGYKPEVPAENTDLASLRQQDLVTQSAATPSKGQDLEMRLNNASSEAEILEILQSQQ